MERWQRIDAASDAEAAEQLRICCGASRWVDRMLARRPFGSADAVRSAARQEWFALPADDWKQAFARHPRIGDVDGLRAKFGHAAADSEREQAAAAGARGDVLDALADANREYERRFGYIFIVCAAGKTAAQMLTIARDRLANPPDVEIRIAAEEHARICDLRLRSDV